jgi:hypothetical protein
MKRLRRFILRLFIARRVIKSKHVICIYLTSPQLIELITDNTFKGDISYSYAGLMNHQAMQAIKCISQSVNDVDIICEKGIFEAIVDEKLKNKSK